MSSAPRFCGDLEGLLQLARSKVVLPLTPEERRKYLSKATGSTVALAKRHRAAPAEPLEQEIRRFFRLKKDSSDLLFFVPHGFCSQKSFF